MVTRLTCPGCTVQLDGRFDLPGLLRLNREDLEFVLDFVRCSGSVKDLCLLRGLTYPTIRNRLNDAGLLFAGALLVAEVASKVVLGVVSSVLHLNGL